MKNKKVIIFLIIGCGFWVLSDVYWFLQRYFILNKLPDYNSRLDFLIIPIISILIPISFLIYAISLLNSKQVKNTEDNTDKEPLLQYENMTVGNWLVTFLITLIPLGGLVAMIMWANDESNKIKKNWAIASLIYQGIFLVLMVFIYFMILSSARNAYSIF